METKSQKVNTFLFFIIILLSSHHSLGAPKGTWVGSKYHIECTMCAACDNPCNQQPPPSSLPPPPPSSSSSSTGGGYYYSPPPPSSTGGGYYYSPPPPSQGAYYYYPPAATGNYPAPGTPNPVTNYFPYYYHNSPQYDSATVLSLSGATVAMLNSWQLLT
ncbi:hypothetical protein HanHA300_Chr16g0608711 [Helianthus annuus]|nr:hypothetical protein HanHA300_Chr16g0608711 [Helianthus annuus]KAJ0460315.1 hypothetical protein HanHA89_Chr16g0659351 [Helianthus annuus]KAJ0640758.1 hypothetical protein HanLR1_Chr16g0619341 [Helianthus annuus]